MTRQAGLPDGGASGDQDEVARFLVELRALGRGEPPAPSHELAALLGGATPLAPRRHARRVILRSGIAAAAIVTGLVVAAANHDLPRPAQRVVSNVVDVLTPFEIAPDTIVPTTPTPTHTRPAVVPSEDDPTSPAGSDDRSSGPDDRSSGSDDRSGGYGDGSGSGGQAPGSDDGAATSAAPSGGDHEDPTSAPRTGGELESGGSGSDN